MLTLWPHLRRSALPVSPAYGARWRPAAAITIAVTLALLAPGYAQGQCQYSDGLVFTGVGKNAIPDLTNPEFVSAEEGDNFWPGWKRVLGVVMNGEARAYPLPIMWWHEIVNDVLGGVPIAVTYCPLTRSGVVYDPVIDGQHLSFGTSGLLFDNNLVMYDRNHVETLWPQMRTRGLCGLREGFELALYPVVELTWEGWKKLHPETTVLTTNTGYNRKYTFNPYGDYWQIDNPQIQYPHSFVDPRLPEKALVHGIEHEGVARAYLLDSLAERGEHVAVNDAINGLAVVVVYDRESGMAVSFERRTRVLKKNGKWRKKTFALEAVPIGAIGAGEVDSPFLLHDRKSGTLFDLTGRPIAGKWAGRVEGGSLTQLSRAYNAFWFAWASFNLGTEIF